MRNRRANPVTFGFDFQVHAAIMILLDNIKELKSLRLEGNYEDIEIKMNDDSYILAQAKSIVRSSEDFSNVLKNLKKAIKTLSESAGKVHVHELIYITNSPNPFNNDSTRSIFWGPTIRKFTNLPEVAQKIIEKYLNASDVPNPFDKNNFTIYYFPFETDDDAERYKAVKQRVDDFIGELGFRSTGIGKQLLTLWYQDTFRNSTKQDSSIVLSKNALIWPLLVIVTDIQNNDDDYWEQFDIAIRDEVINNYHSIIDSCCEKIDFFMKVLFDYRQFQCDCKQLDKISIFVNTKWQEYITEFKQENIDPETCEVLVKTIINTILRRRITIEKIKKGVKL